MKILNQFLAILAAIFGGRAQSSTSNVTHENPITQSPAPIPSQPLAISYIDPADEPDAIVPVPVATIPKHDARLDRALVVKHNPDGTPARARFISRKGNIRTASVVQTAGDLLLLRRGKSGTFVRSAA